MPLSASEQKELDDLEFKELSAKEAASVSPKAAVEPAPAATAIPERVTPDDLKLLSSLGAEDRLKMFMAMSIPYAKRELIGDAKGGGAAIARGAGPALGQKLGQFTKVPGADRLLGGIGGSIGEFVGEKIAGEPTNAGRIAAAFVPGAMRGKSLVGATSGEVAKEATANAAGNVAGENINSIITNHRLANAQEDASAAAGGVVGTLVSQAVDTGAAGLAGKSLSDRNAPANALKDQFRKKGYVFVPSKSGSAAGGDLTDYLGGASPNTSALANVASLRNQEVTNDLARSYIGVKKNVPLDEPNIASIINKAEAPYRAVAAVSPQAAASLDMYKQANADAKRAWRAYDRAPSPELQKFAKDNTDLADLALDDIKIEAAKAGKSSLVPELDKARVELAKIHLVDRSINYGDYNVSAKTFAHAKDYGAPLSDDGDLIARMYKANPGIMRDASSVTTVGSGKIPLVSAGVRSLALSDLGQKILSGKPASEIANEDFLAKALRLGILSESRGTEEQPVPQPGTQ